ncbi:MAG TPA: sigma-70 family RNA polymerase sigma factor [Polyangiaceae bacterium]|nr:sigma-70 family RNA polymerase sigma factor [Polyangiaceae bacterium]
MALQSIKRPIAGAGRLDTPVRAIPSSSPVSRISPADELQLACRLAECRRELLAISLLDAETALELHRLATELASLARRPGDVLDLEHSAEAAVDAGDYLAELRELSREAWPLIERTRQRELSRLEDEALEQIVERVHERLKAQPLSGDVADRLLQTGWAAPTPTRGARELPPALRKRVRCLSAEVDTIRSRFINANQGLVAYVVQRYRGMGLRREDLMQEGNIGLLRAIEKFDHRRGTRFSVYAVWWIRQAVRRALANQSRTIRIPVHALAVRYAIDQAAKRLALQLGREPSEQELASATGVVASGVAQVLGMVREPLSLDAPRGPDSENSLGESVADRGTISPNEHAARRERADRLHVLLEGLTSREQEMLRMRFGLDGADECTLEQIGQSFALTRERVRQIVTAALGKLHHQTQVRRLELEPTAD